MKFSPFLPSSFGGQVVVVVVVVEVVVVEVVVAYALPVK